MNNENRLLALLNDESLQESLTDPESMQFVVEKVRENSPEAQAELQEFTCKALEGPSPTDAELEQEELERAYSEYLRELDEREASDKYFPAEPMARLCADPLPPIPEYSKHLIFAGAITIIAGDPKAGKSTLMLHALNALVQGKPFLWGESRPQTVLYASEQSRVSFRKQAERIPELTTLRDFRVILFENNRIAKRIYEGGREVERYVPPSSWEEQVEIWRAAIKKNRATVLVIDTFTAFANFRGGEASDSGVVQARLQTLKSLLVDTPNLGIVILHHLRKEPTHQFGGNKMKRGFLDFAGSYAFRAGSDQNILIYRPDTHKENANVRVIQIEGRFVEQPQEFTIELTPEGFQLVEAHPVSARDLKRQQNDAEFEALTQMVREHPEWQTMGEPALFEATGGRIAKRVIRAFKQKYPKGTSLPPLS